MPTFEFFAYTKRECFQIEAESEEEARKLLADDPYGHIVGGYNCELTPQDFDLNHVEGVD